MEHELKRRVMLQVDSVVDLLTQKISCCKMVDRPGLHERKTETLSCNWYKRMAIPVLEVLAPPNAYLACMRAERECGESSSSSEAVEDVQIGVHIIQPIRERRVCFVVPLPRQGNCFGSVVGIGLALVVNTVERGHLRQCWCKQI